MPNDTTLARERGAAALDQLIEFPKAWANGEAHPSHKNAASVCLIRGSDLKPEPICWLWKDWLACGKLHIVAGAPGTGKTTIAMTLAATVMTGGRWPDGTSAEPGNVLVWSGEDDPSDTLLPRLLVQGADRGRVYFVSDVLAEGKRRPFDPARVWRR